MRWFFIIAGSALMLLAIFFASREYNTSICVKTGMRRVTRAYGPIKMHTVQPTALSQVLTTSGYRNPKQHDWVYEHGGGWFLLRRRYSASGNALSLGGTVSSTQVASAVGLMIAYTDKATVEKWLRRIFDPATSFEVSSCLFDVGEHTNRMEFVRWLGEQEIEFRQMQQK